MSEQASTTTPLPKPDHDGQHPPAVDPASPSVAGPSVVVQPIEVRAERKFSWRSFIAGFVTAGLVAGVGLLAFLAVSDADDDGEIELEVPAVDVDVNG